MNLRAYYQKIRETEVKLKEPFVVLCSHATPDGGREGSLTEAPRALAAQMIADGRARAADEADAKAFRKKNELAKEQAEQEAAGRRMQVTLVPTSELKAMKNAKPRE